VHQHDLGIDLGGWGPDWPDGYGFLDELVNGNTIVPAGNTNIGELNDPVVNNLFAKAAGITDAAQRNAIWGQIDHQVMKDAVIVPEVYAKALMYRPPSLTNVYFNPAYQIYNYAVLGLK
jgi:peptide/nickel transport system substrate-binding protein